MWKFAHDRKTLLLIYLIYIRKFNLVIIINKNEMTYKKNLKIKLKNDVTNLFVCD